MYVRMNLFIKVIDEMKVGKRPRPTFYMGNRSDSSHSTPNHFSSINPCTRNPLTSAEFQDEAAGNRAKEIPGGVE